MKALKNTYLLNMIFGGSNPDGDPENIDFVKAVLRVLVLVNPKEAIVLCLRSGFINHKKYSLREVAFILNLTAERIRQIEAKALRKLRHPTRSKKLENFVL